MYSNLHVIAQIRIITQQQFFLRALHTVTFNKHFIFSFVVASVKEMPVLH